MYFFYVCGVVVGGEGFRVQWDDGGGGVVEQTLGNLAQHKHSLVIQVVIAGVSEHKPKHLGFLGSKASLHLVEQGVLQGLRPANAHNVVGDVGVLGQALPVGDQSKLDVGNGEPIDVDVFSSELNMVFLRPELNNALAVRLGVGTVTTPGTPKQMGGTRLASFGVAQQEHLRTRVDDGRRRGVALAHVDHEQGQRPVEEGHGKHDRVVHHVGISQLGQVVQCKVHVRGHTMHGQAWFLRHLGQQDQDTCYNGAY